MDDFHVGECDWADRFLADRIYEFNARAAGYSDGESFAAVRPDESETIVAGISGYKWGGCCYVAHLWVSERLCAQGAGRALLLAAEAHAKGNGCQIVLQSSHSFQSPAFYQKTGYLQVASITDLPVGHTNIVFAKRFG